MHWFNRKGRRAYNLAEQAVQQLHECQKLNKQLLAVTEQLFALVDSQDAQLASLRAELAAYSVAELDAEGQVTALEQLLRLPDNRIA